MTMSNMKTDVFPFEERSVTVQTFQGNLLIFEFVQIFIFSKQFFNVFIFKVIFQFAERKTLQFVLLLFPNRGVPQCIAMVHLCGGVLSSVITFGWRC